MPTPSEIEQFRTRGAAALRGVFSDWVETLRRGIEKNMAEPGPFARDYNEPDRGRFFNDYCNWRKIDEYREFLFHSPAAEIARSLMGSTGARLFHEHVLVKEAQTAIPTPWHHDQPYYCVDGKQNCSLWIALDPVPRETALEFMAGSHLSGKWYRPLRFNNQPLYDEDQFETLPDIDAHRDEFEILGWDTEPGDAIAFHFLTLHGAPGNSAPLTRRRAFSSRWLGDDATFAARRGRTSPPFPDCTLRHGDRLEGPDFPLILS